MKDNELDRLFREVREEEWPVERLPEWRDKVRTRVDRRRLRRWYWIPVPALAAAAIAVVLLRPTPVQPPASMARTPEVAATAWKRAPRLASDPPVQSVNLRKPRPRVAPAPKPQLARATPEPGQTEFIRIMTDDPDVVILWAVNGDGKGESQ